MRTDRPRKYKVRLAEERLLKQVRVLGDEDCWEWQGATNTHGYGQPNIDGRRVLAHRFFYAWQYGAIPAGQCVLHRCDNPKCCNPLHLFLGTQADNMRDKVDKGRQPWGERHSRSKLTGEQVDQIKRLHDSGTITKAELARRFAVSWSAVYYILLGTNWKGQRVGP